MVKALTRFLPHPLVFVTFIVAFAFYAVFGNPVFDDPDMPWHIAAGDWIRAHHSIPVHDPFSFSAGETPWYNISWAWDVVLSQVVDIGGLGGLRVFAAFATASVLAFLCYSLQRRATHEDPIKVILFLTGLVLWNYSLARPQVMSYLLIIAFQSLLHYAREERRYKGLLWLPPLMVLWVNTHGAFLVGLSLLGAYGLEAMLRKEWHWFPILLLTGVMTTAAIFINPYGVEIIIATLRTLDSAITPYINEWHPFTFGAVLSLTLYVLTLLLVSNPREKSIPLVDKILTFCWLFMALTSIRNFTVLVFIAAPYMVLNIEKAMVLKPYPDVSAYKYRMRMAMLGLVVVAVLSVPQMQAFLGNDSNAARVPEKEMAFIEKHYPKARFLNDYDLGGYIMYYMRDSSKLFVDGRAGTAYSEALLGDLITFFLMDSNFEEMAKRYKIEGVIVRKGHTFNMKHSSAWKEVFSGDVAKVYMRKGAI